MTGAQLRMARAALKLGVRDIAAIAKVSPNTITRIESDLPSNASTVAAVRYALEAAGVEFIEENGGGPGVRLRKGGSSRATDHPKPVGPATDAVKAMDEAITHNRKQKCSEIGG